MSKLSEVLKMKPENAKALVIVVGGLAAVVVIIIVINKVFGGFKQFWVSIFGDPAEKAAQQKALSDAKTASDDVSSPWNVTFYQNSSNGASISDDQAQVIAKAIWDSEGFFMGADSAALMSALKQIQYQVDLSLVSQWFTTNYSEDLYTWLTKQFGNNMLGNLVSHTDTMTGVNSYVASLPKYY